MAEFFEKGPIIFIKNFPVCSKRGLVAKFLLVKSKTNLLLIQIEEGIYSYEESVAQKYGSILVIARLYIGVTEGSLGVLLVAALKVCVFVDREGRIS